MRTNFRTNHDMSPWARVRPSAPKVETPSICIVGGGMGGIAAGVKLVKAGIQSFTIFEKSSGLGGTWWDNRYPGAECDVPSHLYSYGFHAYDWSRTHARQPEIQTYLETVVDAYGLRSHFRFSAQVVAATWDDVEHNYIVTFSNGDVRAFCVVISAVGLLNHPNIPDWEGFDRFKGPRFHSARWEPGHDLDGKTVAIVGTGSTAVQITAELATVAGKLLVFQRDPGWVLPKDSRDFTDEERQTLRKPSRRRLERARLIYRNEKGLRRGDVFHPGSKLSLAGEARARRFIDEQFADQPELRKAVTPSYPYPGKRPVFHSDYYATLRRENVQLIASPVSQFTATGIVDGESQHHPVDVVILATGFTASNYLPRLEIRGRNGREIHEVWAGEPQAFLGITVPDFPNLYILYGPNTNGGEIISVLERGAEFAVRAVKTMIRRQVTAIEVRKAWHDHYNKWMQSKMQGTSWTKSRNYFTSASGRVVTQWPFGAVFYGVLTKTLGPLSETRRRASGAQRRNKVPFEVEAPGKRQLD